MKNDFTRLTRWAIFTVGMALLPLVVTALGLVTYSRPLRLSAVTKNGELLLVAVAIGGGALGELISPRTKSGAIRKLICGGATFFCVLLSAMLFALTALGTGPTNVGVVSFGSIILFGLTVLSSFWCLVLSEV